MSETVAASDADFVWKDVLFRTDAVSRTSGLSTSTGIQARRLKAVDRLFARL
jgi:hypothetical protein